MTPSDRWGRKVVVAIVFPGGLEGGHKIGILDEVSEEAMESTQNPRDLTMKAKATKERQRASCKQPHRVHKLREQYEFSV